MKNIKWTFLGFAILAAACIMGIGIAIGEKSYIIAVISVVALLVTMGIGFKTKKKYRENGLL